MKSGSTIQYTQHYPSTSSGQAPSTSSGQAPSTSSGQAPSAALRAGSSGIEYRQGASGAPAIEAIYHPEGRVFYTSATTSRYEYSIRNPASAALSTGLGNTRLTLRLRSAQAFSDLNGTCPERSRRDNKVNVSSSATTNEVLQENQYYCSVGATYYTDAAIRRYELFASIASGTKEYKSSYIPAGDEYLQWLALIGAHELGHMFLFQVLTPTLAEKHYPGLNLMGDHASDPFRGNTLGNWLSSPAYRAESAKFYLEQLSLIQTYYGK